MNYFAEVGNNDYIIEKNDIHNFIGEFQIFLDDMPWGNPNFFDGQFTNLFEKNVQLIGG